VAEGQALQQKLTEVEHMLTDKVRQLSDRTKEVSQDAQDRAQLIRWVGQLDRCFTSVINSKRWQLGHSLATVSRKIRFQPPLPLPQEHWESLMKEFAAWRKAGEDRNKARQIPPKPASGPSAAALPAPARPAGKGNLT